MSTFFESDCQERAWEAERDETLRVRWDDQKEKWVETFAFVSTLVVGLVGEPPAHVSVTAFPVPRVELLARDNVAELARHVFAVLPEPHFYGDSGVWYVGEVDGYQVKVYGAASRLELVARKQAELAALEVNHVR